MGPEINISSILALEKQIEERLGNVIQLKRTRNSLLNISTRVPPEVLGQVFRWNVIPVGDFAELQKGSYNFLLVCHHWFEVAAGTPELWTFWGNTLEQWSRRYQRSGTAPLDLVLHARHVNARGAVSFNGPLRDALRDHAARGSIRSIHLRGRNTNLLLSVIYSSILEGEDIRYSSIESLTLEHTNLDISDFFSRCRFPKLRVLRLSTSGRISSWEHLRLQATSLTTLSLEFTRAPKSPATSQLLSILTSYPNLHDLTLHETMIPHDVGDGSAFRVPLHRLEKLELIGNCHHVFRLLRRLEYPDTLDSVRLHLLECVGEGVSEFLEPYLRDRIQRDDRFQGRLGIISSCTSSSILFEVNILGEFSIPITLPRHGRPSVSFTVIFRDMLPRGADEKLCIDLIAPTPRERVVDFTGGFRAYDMRDLLITMPNIENLNLTRSVVSDTFLQLNPLSHTKLLPSLRHLCLDYFTLQNGDNWNPLIAYLRHQTSGGQAISLGLRGVHPSIPLEVVREIESLVDEFDLGYSGEDEGY